MPLLAVTFLIGVAASASAADSALERLAGDYDYCTVCHGANGQGNVAIQAPALAGIETWYLRSRLQAYRAQHLGVEFARDPSGTEMRTVAREIDAARIPGIADYIAHFRPAPQARTLPGNTVNGRRLYATHCATCHGERGTGNELLHAPGLQRLNDWYFVAAFGKYRSGLRGTASDDVFGTQMRVLASSLPADFAINDVVAYIQSLRTGGPRRSNR
jgi:cytochrome c oxidase subunit 2